MTDHFVIQSLVGISRWTERIHRRVFQLSDISTPVLISGPSGSGKQRIARLIHAQSPRSRSALIPFRCGQLPGRLEASQLFGHTAGEGVLTAHAALGCIGSARGGTLLLEDVDTLSLDHQARLAEFLKRQVTASRCPATKGGDSQSTIRLIATTSRDLRVAVRDGEFSAELFFCLSTSELVAEPLAHRRDDILPLTQHLLARITFEFGIAHRQLTPAAIALLEAYDWPGNVDELELQLERAVLDTSASVLDADDFPELLDAVHAADADFASHHARPSGEISSQSVNDFESVQVAPAKAGHWPTMDELEANHIRATLVESRYRVAIAARLLGMDATVLVTKMRQHGIRLPLPQRSVG